MTMATGVILAGGQGRRMGGADKGLQLLNGRSMIAWVLDRFTPQVGEVLVSANRNLAQYANLGYRVIPDLVGQQAGPLAGMHRGLTEARAECIVCVPCDAPALPLDLAERLAAGLRDDLEACAARAGGRTHPVFCMVRRSTLPQLTAFLEDGGRKVEAWLATLRMAWVEFPDAGAFLNVNSAADLQAIESAAAQAPPASRR